MIKVDPESLKSEVEEEFIRSSGPGGQHRNKVETGVRLTHLPTGIVVTATEERSQARNRQRALERLAEKLEERERRKRRKKRRPTRKSRAVREREIKQKKRTGEKKRTRGRVAPEE